jgi:hypothetical protein
VRSGDLARVKVGNRTLFEPATVRSFIAGCREEPLPHADDASMIDAVAEASSHA